MPRSSFITRTLERRGDAAVAIYGSIVAFSTYFSMYAFRKPFTVGRYEDLELWGLEYKIVLILAQLAGYTTSKFLGIKFVSELERRHRVPGILILIAVAELALVLFAVVPFPYHVLCLFLNGLPLGMVWGFVFAFLEGRRTTEILSAGLSASFIVSSGVVKSVASFAMNTWGVSEYAAPAVTGLLFLGPLAVFAYLLGRIPEPTDADRSARTERAPMTRTERNVYLRRLGFGVGLLVLVHMMLTAFRDFRDNFQAEILHAIGFGDDSLDFARSETLIAAIVLVLIATVTCVRNNARALGILHGFLLVGVLITGASTLAFRSGVLAPYAWFTIMGFGNYLAYVPFHSVLFDRVIAVFGRRATAGFLIYVADATGYLASVALLLYRDFGAPELSWLEFVSFGAYALAIAGSGCVLLAFGFFVVRSRRGAAFDGSAATREELGPDVSP